MKHMLTLAVAPPTTITNQPPGTFSEMVRVGDLAIDLDKRLAAVRDAITRAGRRS